MLKKLKEIEMKIGYKFSNPDLLRQAFIRKSYSEENGGENNEILEFIGDKALDLVVIRVMMDKFAYVIDEEELSEFKESPKYFKTELDEGNFTDKKKGIVDKNALSYFMDLLGFQTNLIMGRGDYLNNVQNEDSVKEDLFEAIIGAVAIDSNWNMDILTKVVCNMIDFDAYFSEYDDNNFIGKIQNFTQKYEYELPRYYYEETFDGYVCTLKIEDLCKASAFGKNKAKAKMNVAKKVYEYLLDEGYIKNNKKTVIEKADINENESLRQLNELVQKKIIDKPDFKLTQYYDENGNAVWICECESIDKSKNIKEFATSKKEAQRKSAYKLLLDLINDL